MSADFWFGVAAIPAAAVVTAGAAWAIAGARRSWRKLHEMLLFQRVKLAPDLQQFGEEPRRTTHTRAANMIRDALLESPRFTAFGGLGWRVLVVRDSKVVDK